MNIKLPQIIQGGMGAGISDWRLARAVSKLGQLGVISGTALDQIMARRLQEGDPGGHIRSALQRFPFPRMAQRILDRHFVPGGKPEDTPYKVADMHRMDATRENQELCIAANFVEVTLAREEHDNPVGINYLEKIQLPHLPSIYGAMLAGVAVVIAGAGIPLEMPGVLDNLSQHEDTSYPIIVKGGGKQSEMRMHFSPRDFWEESGCPAPLDRPDFLPIVSSDALVKILCKRANGIVSGFIVEGHSAGGHNAPPRGKSDAPDGQPVYTERDAVNLQIVRDTGLPFWLAGGYGTPAKLQEALEQGAAGVQVGSAFALCEESGMIPELRRALVSQIASGEAKVFTDPKASPTGFPFKVMSVAGSLSERDDYDARRRLCDLGYLRQPYVRDDGTIGYRCPAEPIKAYVAKGGEVEETTGRKCLCNALVANIGMPQILKDGGREKCLITLGDDLESIGLFCSADSPDYSAAKVIRVLQGQA